MKCINRVLALLISISVLILSVSCKTRNEDSIPVPFERNSESSSVSLVQNKNLYDYYIPYAHDLCVDEGPSSYVNVTLEGAYAAGLFDVTNNKVLYQQNMYETMTPASITKLLTTLVALKYCDLNDVLEFNSDCVIKEAGAQKIGFKEGDKITLEQALNILLLYSANDVAMMIAVNYEGGYEEFLSLMNEEADIIGATHTNFVNPHGLTEENHESSVYDLYLILNELLNYDKFKQIVCQNGYTTSYTKADGTTKTIEISTTNNYINGKKQAPEGFNILGGKTGTTEAAGKCLIIYFTNSEGNEYIACILKDSDYDILYEDMNKLIEATQ